MEYQLTQQELTKWTNNIVSPNSALLRIFTELISSTERICSEVTELIKDQEKAAVSRAEEFLKRQEQKTADLRKKEAELEQLSHAEECSR